MSDMFNNYNLDENAPNNLTRVHNFVHCKMPYAEYDEDGHLVAYTWKYGETVNLRFQLNGMIKIDNDAIVYYAKNDVPNAQTVGFIDQRAYNVVDLRSWTCTAILEDEGNLTYIWTEDPEFYYPFNGGRSLYISIQEYMKNKKVIFTFMDNRYFPIFERVVEPEDTFFTIPIDEELSNSLQKGVYFYKIAIVSNDSVVQKIVADPETCVINIR